MEPVAAATDVWVEVGAVDVVMAVLAAAGGGCDVTEVGERPGFWELVGLECDGDRAPPVPVERGGATWSSTMVEEREGVGIAIVPDSVPVAWELVVRAIAVVLDVLALRD